MMFELDMPLVNMTLANNAFFTPTGLTARLFERIYINKYCCFSITFDVPARRVKGGVSQSRIRTKGEVICRYHRATR